MLIVCVLWAFIGYFFTDRYLLAGVYPSVIGAAIMVLIVIQIERQVILTPRNLLLPGLFRAIIAIIMAVIGSFIIDQIIFKEDIEHQKILMLDDKVDAILPKKAAEIRRQIAEVDSTILAKEQERKDLLDDISKNPTVTIFARSVTRHNVGVQNPDSLTKETVTRTSSQIPNPKIAFLQPFDEQISALRMQKMKKDSILLQLRPAIEAELMAHNGFLDELNVMFTIINQSRTALVVWILWFSFILGLELFVLVNKSRGSESDYEARVRQQMDLHLRRVQLLRQQ
ncbi:MAG: DUF4407 domain-containing protein [Cyclobacteriaceae bacterium]|nr:DUF4407 domain-containing protein [Cyclobacteriaceae bacterium]